MWSYLFQYSVLCALYNCVFYCSAIWIINVIYSSDAVLAAILV
jgi:hypothetical protein